MSTFTVEVCTTFVIDGDSDSMRAVYPAQYEYAPTRQVIRYAEHTDGGDIPTTVEITEGCVDILRQGLMDMHLREGEEVSDVYDTGCGTIDVRYTADRIRCALTRTGGNLDLRYTMELGGVTTCNHVILRLKMK